VSRGEAVSSASTRQVYPILKGSTRNNSGIGLVISKYYLSAFLIVEGEEGDH
jgi:hypothetical protein